MAHYWIIEHSLKISEKRELPQSQQIAVMSNSSKILKRNTNIYINVQIDFVDPLKTILHNILQNQKRLKSLKKKKNTLTIPDLQPILGDKAPSSPLRLHIHIRNNNSKHYKNPILLLKVEDILKHHSRNIHCDSNIIIFCLLSTKPQVRNIFNTWPARQGDASKTDEWDEQRENWVFQLCLILKKTSQSCEDNSSQSQTTQHEQSYCHTPYASPNLPSYKVLVA